MVSANRLNGTMMRLQKEGSEQKWFRIVLQLLCFAALWFLLVGRPEQVLDDLLLSTTDDDDDNDNNDRHTSMAGIPSREKLLAPSPDVGRYIIYRSADQARGQGVGNLVNGVLAAHLLGEEFNRIVCVYWPEFELAFERTRYNDACAKLKHDDISMMTYPDVYAWNFATSDTECYIVDILRSDAPIVSYSGNTYPKWPLVKNGFFDAYYSATPLLEKVLPWKEGHPPKVVVHLRQGDSGSDKRKGLDNRTLQALGEYLPSHTFLVTNQVGWYDYFASNFGWSTPNWEGVQHSAISAIHWRTANDKRAVGKNDAFEGLDPKQIQTMYLWCDWYSILRAQEVYHTHSDFSLSAIHWSNITSRTIMGMTQDATSTQRLDLIDEPWRRDGEWPPLSRRPRNNLTTISGERCQGLKPKRRSKGHIGKGYTKS